MRRRNWFPAVLVAMLLALAASLPAYAGGTPLVQPLRLDDCNLPAHWAAPYACDLIHQGMLDAGQIEGRLDDPVSGAQLQALLGRGLQAEAAAPITRLRAMTLLAEAVGGNQLAGADTRVLANYRDAAGLDPASRQAVAFLLLTGVIQGRTAGVLNLADPITLGEAIKMLDVAMPERLPTGTDKLTLLLYNDFHGHLQQDAKQRPHLEVGIERLTTAIQGQKLHNPETLLIDGGDAFQGTPISNLVSGQSVQEWRNQVGVKVATIGNHEFDWKVDTLKNLMAQSTFPMLSANIFMEGTDRRPDWATPSATVTVGGYKIGVIGITTPVTKSIVVAANVAGLDFRDPAPYIDEQAKLLRAGGADLVIVVAHSAASPGTTDKFQVENEVAQFMKNVTVHIDAVTGAHSHEQAAGYVRDAAGNMVPVIQAGSYGRALGRIDLYIDHATRTVTNAVPVVWEPAQTLAPTPWATDLIARWDAQIKPIESRPVGKLTGPISRKTTDAGESALGDFIADSMLTAAPGIQIALMNGGGIRADLEGDPATGDVNWGHLFTVEPFGNTLVTVAMTGAQLKTVLEQAVTSYVKSVTKQPGGHQPIQAAGITFAWDFAKPEGQRVDPASLKLADGTPVAMNATYKVVVNSFMAGGGDDLTQLKDLTKAQIDVGVIDLDVLVDYFKAQAAGKPLGYSLQNRISVTNFPAH